MPAPFEFDFRKPDYGKIFRWRLERLPMLDDPLQLAGLKAFYRKHPGQFITDWGCTSDPRNADIGLPVTIPFVLFEKQEEWTEEVMASWRGREPMITEKSREVGVSWLSVSLACTLCILFDDLVIGFGSRKEEYVDKIGAPKALFWKARKFMEFVPPQFKGSWNVARNAPHMRILFPDTRSAMTGESGDGIGRGDRTSIYFVDESAYIERPELMEASLAATTNCRIDVSSAKGMANKFAERRFSGRIKVFTISWRDDPRKDQEWYEKQKRELDPVTLAQEIDINYSASVEGVVIPNEWAQAAVGAAEKLGIVPTGARTGALDVADQGIDLNAFCVRHGCELIGIRAWSGKNSDTLYTAEAAFLMCDEFDLEGFQYDADGLGAGIRGDGRMINERRQRNKERVIDMVAYRGSGEVIDPEKDFVKGRKNKDYFRNRKAQSWFHARRLFQNTFRAISGEDFDKDSIISISPKLPDLSKVLMELSQASYKPDDTGKMVINKAPEKTRSPNHADAIIINYSPAKRRNSLFS